MENKGMESVVLTLRTRSTGVEARSAVLEGERYDIIRGKDFVRWVRANMDQVDLSFLRSRTPDEAAHELGTLLLRRDLLVRCDRKFKKPPPGQDRLIKFPKKVVLVTGSEAKTFAEGDFYAWRFDPPVSPAVYVLSALGALGVVAVCLFPIAPSWLKVAVVYFLMGLLVILVGFLVLRAFVAAATWIFTGRTLWILPNAMADDKPISELFSPVISVEDPKLDGSAAARAKHLALRVATAAGLAAVVFVLYTKSPGTDKLRANAGKYRDEIFDMLNVHNDRGLLKGNVTTEAAAAGGDGTAAEGGAPAEAAQDAAAKEEL